MKRVTVGRFVPQRAFALNVEARSGSLATLDHRSTGRWLQSAIASRLLALPQEFFERGDYFI
jgi:hypothetical protein